MTPKPIKRNESIVPFSRDHHHGLLLGWKIKQGFKFGIEVERMKKYVDWFWVNQLEEHFDLEEKYIFPVLGGEHPHVKEAVAQHQIIKELFLNQTNVEDNLKKIINALTAHIRFEERVLFNEVQEVATEEQLKDIEKYHRENKTENTEDEFWIAKKD